MQKISYIKFDLIFQALAVPSVAFEPRFQGAFRNLEYSSEGTRPEKQEMMAYKVRKNTPFLFNLI